MSTLSIGAAGELLVQFRLLRAGIDSARLTTDAGVDLVAFHPVTGVSRTIQVKAKDTPTAAGGRGALMLNWSFPAEARWELLALVDLTGERVWLLDAAAVERHARPASAKGAREIGAYLLPPAKRTRAWSTSVDDLDPYRLETVVESLFQAEPAV